MDARKFRHRSIFLASLVLGMFLATDALSQGADDQILVVPEPYPSLTVTGSAGYLGGTAFPAVDGCWFLDGKFGFAIAIALSPSHMEIHGAAGVTTVESQAMTAQEVIDAIADGSEMPQLSLNCASNEQECECTVEASRACDGIVIQSRRCCPVADSCSCLPTLGSSGCTLKVKATCSPGPSPQ